MSDKIFYVESRDDKGITGYVPAKFLMRNGAYVMNPAPGGSQQSYIYSDGSGNNKMSGVTANPDNYLIVPKIYTELHARDFAARIAQAWSSSYPGDLTGAAGPVKAVLDMAKAFVQGGSQDLQRNPQWGIPDGSVVPAFVGAASNHLGFVTGLAGIPKALSQIGGGAANTINADVVQTARGILHLPTTSIDTHGPYGLSRQNDANISQGYSDGIAASQPPSGFDYYGYGTPARRAGQIGDGKGIAEWTSYLGGVDPEEPTPPAWQPQADQPIRYLGSRRVQ
jgi:hypothetical protein